MGTYTTSAINYYRVNANNTTIAQSPKGDDGTPSEEITPPLATVGTFGTYSTAGGVYTITGIGTVFSNFAVNQYLYYTDSNGDYKLVGQIATINTVSNTSLTLTAAAVNQPTANSVLSASYALITNNESIYIRIATAPGASTVTRYIPNFGLGYWRLNNKLTGVNNPSQSALQRISNVGTPLSNSPTVENISFTFVTMNQFIVASQGGIAGVTYFRNTNDFPNYVWIKVTPQIGTSTSLSSQTLYRFITQETMEALTIQQQTSGQTLSDAGYNNVSTGTTTNTGPAENV